MIGSVTRIVLILPTSTYRAEDFLAAGRRLGVEVIVASDAPPALAGRSIEIDCTDADAAAEALVALDQKSPIDAVVAVDDQGVLAAAVAAKRLGLAHNDPAAVAASRDKALLRRVLGAGEVSQPAWAVLAEGEPGSQAARSLSRLVGYPCVVKPRSLGASQGVIRADDEASLAAAIERVRGIVAAEGGEREASLVVESYVDGEEVAIEGMLSGGRLEVLAVFDKPDPLVGPYFEETIYVTPSRLGRSRLDRIEAVAEQACRAMGLSEGPVHAELRDDGERSWCIEVAARSIGGHCSRALSFGAAAEAAGGYSLEELVIAHALRLERPGRAVHGARGVMMLPAPGKGRLCAVEGQEEALAVEGVDGLEISLHLGAMVLPPPEGSRYLGFIFASGAEADSVEKSLRLAHSKLSFTLSAP